MNINDIAEVPTIKGCPLEMIFERQQALHDKYKDIEVKNNCGYYMVWAHGFNIDDPRSQYYVKDMVWRVTEELAEASEAYIKRHYDHGKEEMADAFHFFIELCIVLGLTPNRLVDMSLYQEPKDRLKALFIAIPIRNSVEIHMELLSIHMWSVVETLGLACNCLKNKPWKQTQMETDTVLMFKYIKSALKYFAELCGYLGISEHDLFETYFKKSEVNKFRQRSYY